MMHMNKHVYIMLVFICSITLLTVNCSADSGKMKNDPQTENPQSDDFQPVSPQPVYPHPEFEIALSQLKKEISAAPEFVQNSIIARPQFFLELTKRFLAAPEWARVLVDKDHPLPEGYAPEDLIMMNSYPLTLNRSTLQLSRSCMPSVLAMTEAARIDGVELVYSSTFRSYAYQKKLYDGYVASHGKQEADRFSARPGTSQHQLGTTIDFGSITPEFEDTPAGQWLYQNAWRYGFSLSYPEGKEELTGYMYEIWHYRYITATGTRLEREFFKGLQQQMLEFYHQHQSFFLEHLSVSE